MSPRTEIWRIEDHACSVCFGRILSRPAPSRDDDEPKGRVYRCAECGVEKPGSSPAVICTCGFKVRGRQNIGMRCTPNDERTPEFPAEIIAKQA